MTLRFFCGCFVIMMEVIQIAILLSNDEYDIIKKNFQQCQFCLTCFVYINKSI